MPAPAHSSTTVGTAQAATLTITSHTVSGTDPALVVKVAYKHTATNDISGITWNTTEDLAKLDTGQNSSNASSELWYLAAPTATTADVVVSFGASRRSVAAASTYTGCDQTNPFRTAAAAGNNGTTGGPTVDIVALADEMVVDSMCQVSAGPDTATGDHTERHDDARTSGGTDVRGASQEIASAGATETMGWTMSSDDNWAIVAGPLQEPQVAGGPAAGLRTLALAGKGI